MTDTYEYGVMLSTKYGGFYGRLSLQKLDKEDIDYSVKVLLSRRTTRIVNLSTREVIHNTEEGTLVWNANKVITDNEYFTYMMVPSLDIYDFFTKFDIK